MNIKFEKCAIRVRVSFDEAVILARDGQLQESLPMPGGALILSVSSVAEGPFSLQARNRYGIEMKVPSVGLGAILKKIEGEHVDKSELELCALAEIGADSVTIGFEIDRFTIARKSSRVKNAEGP